MIIGPIKNIFSFSLFPDQPTNSFVLEVEEVLKDLPKGTIIITDLFGGTPSNLALSLKYKYNCHVISGLDISMLIAANEFRLKFRGKELIDKIIKKSLDNCRDIGQLLDK